MLANFPIKSISQSALDEVQAAIDMKTKPPGSLGRIESLARQICAVQNTLKPSVDPARLLLCAADHGLVAEGVSAWPSEVTTQMVANFLSGGAAANAFASANGVDISIIDAGIIGDLPDHKDLIRANIKKGTANAMHEDAMSTNELEQALEFGAKLAVDAIKQGTKVIAIGEMGIGNTSSATLLTHAVHGISIVELTGPGAGLDDDGVSRKIKILEKTALRKPSKLNAMEALQAYGGLEIAVMAGAVIGTACAGGIMLVDGFIASSAAMCALSARPEASDYTVFAHRSKELGHRLMMSAIGADPLIDLDLRLGEGTGALLAYPMLRAACAMMNDMATFESAGVSDKDS